MIELKHAMRTKKMTEQEYALNRCLMEKVHTKQ
jgi:hypothetical protein